MAECASARDIADGRIDVVAKKHGGGRGQAFVVFDEVASATAALRALSGEQFYERALVSRGSRGCSAAGGLGRWGRLGRWRREGVGCCARHG
jgi:hypothetical protein